MRRRRRSRRRRLRHGQLRLVSIEARGAGAVGADSCQHDGDPLQQPSPSLQLHIRWSVLSLRYPNGFL